MSDVSVLEDDLDSNYERFIAEAIDTGCVWALESEGGFALCPSVSNEEIDVMPMWSQPEYAQAHCSEEWAQYQVVPISLEELLEDWLPGMHGDLTLVGVNWNADMEGLEQEPLDLLEEIDREAAHE
jgi:hypothetical protein